MDLADQLYEAARKKTPGAFGTFSAKAPLVGFVFMAWERIMGSIPEADRARASARMGDAIMSAQLHVDDWKYNNGALGIELKNAWNSAARGPRIKSDMPKQKDFENVASGMLSPPSNIDGLDDESLREYQNSLSLEMRNRHPVTSQELDQVVFKASRAL